MKDLLYHLFDHNTLSRSEAKDILIDISKEKYNAHQVASFISVFLMRSITVDELAGFREALLSLCRPLDFGNIDATDMCGTGGDGKNTFNISTISSIVLASTGKKVIKHGNYGVSSICGSSNVLEALGYTFQTDETILKSQLEECNICFIHAPLFHPAMKFVAPIRKAMGVKTFFNMLGPLVNPAQPNHQVVGVFSLHLQRLYSFILKDERKQFNIIHALDGYDEISLTGNVKLVAKEQNRILNPLDFGLQTQTQESLFGGETIEEAANIFKTVISGNGTTAQQSAIEANTALALQTFEPEKPLQECVLEVRETINSGRAAKTLNLLTR